jgi:hypothetical protein
MVRFPEIRTTGIQRRQGIPEQINDHQLFKKDLLTKPEEIRNKAGLQVSEQMR